MGVGGKGGEGEGKRQGGGSCEFSKEAQLRLAYLRGRVPSRMCSQSPPSWSACACSCALSIMPSAHRQAGRLQAGEGGEAPGRPQETLLGVELLPPDLNPMALSNLSPKDSTAAR